MRSFIVVALAFASAVSALPATTTILPPKPSGVSKGPSDLSVAKLPQVLLPKYPNATVAVTPVATRLPIPSGALLSPPKPVALAPKIVPSPTSVPNVVPPTIAAKPPPPALAPKVVPSPISVPNVVPPTIAAKPPPPAPFTPQLPTAAPLPKPLSPPKPVEQLPSPRPYQQAPPSPVTPKIPAWPKSVSPPKSSPPQDKEWGQSPWGGLTGTEDEEEDEDVNK